MSEAATPAAGATETGAPIPLARPDLGAREEELVLEVLRSGQLSLGPMLGRFESEFAAWLGVDAAVAVSSGTAALHLAVRALGWGRGDEVITSPFSFVASANCLLYEGVKPVFCDVDERTFNLDLEAARSLYGPQTAGLLPVHVFGYPADQGAIEHLAEELRIGVVEDACQALGAVDEEGRKIGTRGNPTTFAFYANKQLTTGEGGMLVAGRAHILNAARSERNQGRGRDMGQLVHDRLGFNYRLPDLAAAIGIAQLERADRLLAERARVAALYREGLAELDGVELPCDDRPPARRSWFVFVIQLPAEADRDAVIEALAGQGVQSKAYLPCIHLQPLYRERFGFKGGEFPIAERIAARSLALPFYTTMGEADVARVCRALAQALGEGRR